MQASVVIISKDECSRLELVLESLALQTLPLVGAERGAGETPGFELVVVNDASSDGTEALLRSFAERHPIQAVNNPQCKGRSESRNKGAELASGDILIFLDGDVLASRTFVEEHVAAHANVDGPCMVRGQNRHLRCTRFFANPQVGSPMPGQEERVAKMGARVAKSVVTLEQVRSDFASVESRSSESVYAGVGPRMLQEIELAAFQTDPDLPSLWMAAAGHNMSFPREEFLAAGGFDARIDVNEHRELALRLMQAGVAIRACDARSYHLLHRVGWRNPVTECSEWERIFYEKHPTAATKLMSVFWQSIAGDPDIPEEARLMTLRDFDDAARGQSSINYDQIRLAHPILQAL